jgi:hypothetical protein
MQSLTLRPLNQLELLLYQEKMGRLTKMIADNNVDVDEAPPPPEVAKLAWQTAELFDSVGFIPTAIGMMIRDEPDILDVAITEECKDAVESGYAEAEAAWRFGPSPR